MSNEPEQSADPALYLRPEVLEASLLDGEWPKVVWGDPDGDPGPGVVITMQVCPFCATALPLDTDEVPIRQMHVDSHVDVLRLIWLASQGGLA